MSSATLQNNIHDYIIKRDSSHSYTMSIKNSTSSNTLINCKLNCLSNPSSQKEVNGSLIWWPPTSQLDSPLIVYIKCDGNYTQNIISAQGRNTTVAIILNYDGKPCQFTSNDIIIPLFNEVNNDCHSNKTNSNMSLSDLEATIKIDNPTPTNITNTSDMSQGYQTAMIVLYTVAGVVLGLFFMVVLVNVIRNRLRLPIDGQDQDDNNQKHGITKAVLESFPVYLFPLQKNTDSKNSENTKKENCVDSNLDSEISKPVPNKANVNRNRRLSPIVENHDDDNIITIPDVIINHDFSFAPEISSPITDNQLTCPICLGEFESGEELRILPCHHQYHTMCIDPWLLDISSLCPMCKADYTSWKSSSITTIHEIASNSSTSLGSIGVLSEIIDSDVTTTQTEGEPSTPTFPHFRWAKYLKAIRRVRRVPRNRQSQSRLSVGDILSSTQSDHSTSRSNLPTDDSEESRVRRWTFSG
ncbi:4577_t:CDS:2 [Cetraspora pellucida]|uniref:4577_t:CDS:1 n=1 Tax=Cetraspora pellucida TaxID=1433469 RepID=A0A9N8ZAI1_9GLOM|nr:4577_t:CDS:2 [Cetraspora pellucida]